MTVPSEVQEAVRQVTGSTLGPVQARTGQAVQQAARTMQADAFTVDGIVHLPSSAPHAHSDEERRVLAHELTHVAQQRRLGSALPHESTPHGQALEAEALRAEALLAPRRSAASAAPSAKDRSMTGTDATAVEGTTTTRPGRGGSAVTGRSAVTGAGSAGGTVAVAPAARPAASVELVPRSTPAAAQPVHASASTVAASPTAPAAPIVSGSTPGGASPAAPAGPSSNGGGVQRRAAGSSADPTPAVRRPTAPTTPPAPASSQPDTSRDQQWLERHAEALYPLIRQQLRAELFRDRERRGRLMREP